MIRALDLLTPFISEVFRSRNPNRARTKWEVFKRTFGVSLFLISIMLNWWLGKRTLNLSYAMYKQREVVAELQICKADLEKAEKINAFFEKAIGQPEARASTGRSYNQYLASLAPVEPASAPASETAPAPEPPASKAKITHKRDRVSNSRYSRE